MPAYDVGRKGVHSLELSKIKYETGESPAKYYKRFNHHFMDSGFFLRNSKLWTRFVQYQEERLRTPGNRVMFILAECTGLQVDAMTWGPSRDNERYVFDHHSIFDHTGAKLSPVECVFYPSLSVRKDSLPILKGIR